MTAAKKTAAPAKKAASRSTTASKTAAKKADAAPAAAKDLDPTTPDPTADEGKDQTPAKDETPASPVMLAPGATNYETAEAHDEDVESALQRETQDGEKDPEDDK